MIIIRVGLLVISFLGINQGDNGGLFFGKTFGKHSLAKYLSPKKTIEGLLGAIIFWYFFKIKQF
jgi:phosphatidate cytidylyltransferase